MAPPDRAERRRRPSIENLEDRRLPSAVYSSSYSSQVTQVRHEYDQFVSELQRLELASHATPEEAQALHDDARLISQDASTTTLSPQAAQVKALAISLQLDRAPLNGWFGSNGWEVVRQRLAESVDGLDVPPSLVDRTITDMEAIARSAGVTSVEEQKLSFDMERLQDGEQSLGHYSVHFPDPQLYYTQHLRGFFRGGTVAKRSAQAQLDADIAKIAAASGDGTQQVGLLRRDARLLERVEASLTSDEAVQLETAYVAAFAGGTPNSRSLQAALDAIPGVSSAGQSNVTQLAADAPALFAAVGSSSNHLDPIITDVQAIVAAGGGTSLDPFRVQVVRSNPVAP